MILYCDFNPRMTREYKLDDLKKKGKNVAENSREYVSGFGIDSVVFTKHLGEKAKVLGFFGGKRGETIIEDLEKFSINYDFVNILDESVEELIIKDISGRTTIYTKKPRITLENEQEFVTKFAYELDGVDMVCLTETDQKGINDGLYELLIKMCYTKGVKVAVTVSKIDDIGKSKPYMLVLNKEELEEYTNVLLSSDEEVIFAANGLIERGIGVVIINSIDGSLILTKEYKLKASFDSIKENVFKINKNLMNAGIAVGFERKYDVETSIKLGLASAIAENFIKFRLISMADIKKIMNKISIREF